MREKEQLFILLFINMNKNDKLSSFEVSGLGEVEYTLTTVKPVSPIMLANK